MEWETVIGLEIHAELKTKSKLFSSAPNRFGDEPNSNIGVVCTGQPGALPLLNREAVRLAVLLGCALNAHVAHFSKFDRKSYFYPDSPRNFQITQFDEPIIIGGSVVAEVNGEEKVFAVNRAHLEDDAGMLKHYSQFAGVDYNRAGVPLIEIVSEPCIHSADEAVAYAMATKAILQYIDASDCNMEEGSLRFDVNISIKPKGEASLRNKVEIKNLNSFSNMERAILAEVKRQTKAYTNGEEVMQATYRFDPDKGTTILMRRKEEADDYRYFPEPDLVPIILSDAYIEEIRAQLPELPLQRERRYVKTLGLTPHNAFLVASDKALADYFEQALADCSNARNICNWLIVEFTGRLKETRQSIATSGIPPAHVAALVNMIDAGTITGKIAKSVADVMVETPDRHPSTIVADNPDFQPLNNSVEIEGFVDQVLAENPQSVSDFLNGKDRAFGFLVGQVMKLSRGKASPQIVNTLIREKINSST